MKSIYIHNRNIRDGVCVHEYDSTDVIANEITWYIKKYTCPMTIILDLDDAISFKSIQRLVKVLRMIVEYNDVALDITLRCDKLLREYEFYDDIKKLL